MAKKKNRTVLASALRKKKKKKEEEKATKKNRIEDAKKAVKKGQQKSALGTKVEKKTETVKVKNDKGKTEKVKYSYENMTMQDYGKMEVGARTGQLQKTLKNDKKLNKKVTDLNVKDYAKSPGAMGALDQMTQGLSVSEDPTYKYSKSQKKIIDSQKKTGKYTAGRVVGAVGEFALGGTGTLGSSIAKTGGKAVLRESAKKGGKALVKQTAKNIAKDTAGDVVASAGLNTLDALKFSYKDGEFDKKNFAKELALNVGGDIVIGGAVSGITHGLSAKQVDNFNKITEKMSKGEALTEAEKKFHDKQVKEIGDEVVSRIRKLKEEDKLKNEQQATRPSDSVDNSVNNIKEEATTISKTETVEQPKAEIPKTNEPDNESIRLTEADDAEYIATNKGNETKRKTVKAYNNGEKVILHGDEEISDFISKATKGEGGKNTVAYGKVNNRLSEEVSSINPNVNLNGSYLEFVPSDLDHSYKHIKAQQKGDIDLTDEDYINIPKYIDTYDEILSIKTDKNNKTTIELGKRINGHAVIVEVVSKGRKSLQFKTMWGMETDAYAKRFGIDINKKTDAAIGAGKSQSLEPEGSGTPYTDEPFSNNKISENSTNVKDATENPGKQYDNTKERIFDENKSAKEFYEKSKRIADDELPRARQTAKKLVNQADDDIADILEPWVRDGYYNKKVLQTQEAARVKALAELNDGTLYRNFMDSKVETDEHLFMARAEALLNNLMKKAPESDDAAMQLLEVMDKATDASSHAGRLLNATKMLLRNTPEGRVRMVSKELERLNTKFADRLGGKKVELSEEQINRIRHASDDEIEDVVDKINLEIWEEIPATWFEKFNEIRHASMLFNAKTHFRNVFGNSVFWGGRLLSDGIELAAYHMPHSPFKKRLEKLGGEVQMVHVTRKELADNKKVLNEIFDANYKKSNSKNKYVETTRPDGMTAVKNKPMSKFIQTNYKLLEKEDMLAFKPEYRKNFIRWCKSHDVKDISNMSKKQMQEANAYAMSRAEKATFRDDSAFAKKIVGWKTTTATKKGKTPIGTAMYRAGNVALESTLPFVKTPVNILRRSVDYSPIGLARGTVELMTAKNADVFMEGVTHMASGLTGTGVFALGILLANKDLIMVKAGEESGDAYYDRDMGYQDYSLILGGEKEYSWTIDWLSPMQVSLFMGANTFNNLSDKGLTLEEMLDGVLAISGPMLDMSFMSSTKDTIETFMEKVYRNGTGEDADWSGAIMKTLFGSVPQGYLSGFVPQLMSQTATALDSKQRDTRSTLEDPIASSWDSFAKKLANKIPVLRNKVLNPKIDRFGDDVTTGNNIVTRLVNAYANPSTVKEIKRTDFDNKIIDIYNHMKDSDDKKYFFYNFTGNPSYDLGNDKRMDYDELYKYGKSKRVEQTKTIQTMFDSASYKNMTWNMRASEVEDAHWISQTHADQKTYGSDFALGRIIDGGSEADSRAAKASQQIGVSSKAFVDFYITKEKLTARSHDSDWTTKALAVALSGNDKMAELYKVNIDKVETAKKYLKKGGSAEEYSTASCNIVSKINEMDVSDSKGSRALAAAHFDINERTYTALGISADEANMGVGLKEMGYGFEKLTAMQSELTYGGFDADKNGSINKEELVDYIESLGIEDTAEKACLFEYLCTTSANNPYGSIPNYLGFSDTDSSGSGGGGGKGRKKNLPSWETYAKKFATDYKANTEQPKVEAYTNPVSWEDYVQDFISKERTSSTVRTSNKSNTGASYQKKISSIIKNM